MSGPLVSVVLPVFNGGAYVERAVRSVLEQDYRRLEVIAIDDGSTDDSLRTLGRLQAQDGRLKIVSRENRGLVPTLNEGLQLAQGELIGRMDADDICYPTRISRQVETFRGAPSLGMCGTNFTIVHRSDRQHSANVEFWPDRDLPILSLFFTAFRHSTVMFNRRVLDPQMLRYDPGYPHAEDFDLFRRITGAHPTTVLREPLLAYRIHPASVTSTAARQMRRTHLKIVCENLQRFGRALAIPGLMQLDAGSLPQKLDEMARLTEHVFDLADSRAASEQPPFRVGASSMFFFLREMAIEEFGIGFAAQFLDRTDGWRRMRRREVYVVQALRGAPSLAMSAWRGLRGLDRLHWAMRSHRLPGLA
ncbi:MAG: family 2 glycosyl transferase [Caulobacteraceae bacterium]|nr:family 2 glycosyl transferase [Caulobacteraceae bacterium]